MTGPVFWTTWCLLWLFAAVIVAGGAWRLFAKGIRPYEAPAH